MSEKMQTKAAISEVRDEIDKVDVQIAKLTRKRGEVAMALLLLEKEMDKHRHPVVLAIVLGEPVASLPEDVLETPFSRDDIERLRTLEVSFTANRGTMFIGSLGSTVKGESLRVGTPAATFLYEQGKRLKGT
jgi:hypothetical protein